MQRILFQIIVLICCSTTIFSQKHIDLQGKVTDNEGNALPYVTVQIKNTSLAVFSNENGLFTFDRVPSGIFTILFTSIGFNPDSLLVESENSNLKNIQISLTPSVQQIVQVNINARADNGNGVQSVKMDEINSLPSISGNIESVVKTLAGVSSNNELSSQYNVRGGSFDDNLVYVNGVEVFKPLLVRSGQQEGLSFVNPDMVSSLKFSAGGFDASYGDKMSSVLDVTYKKPTHHQANVSGSFLGGSTHFEGVSSNKKFTYNAGIRYKTTSYLLGTLDTKGEYQPNFTDAQTLFEYNPNEKISFGLLSHFGQNDYLFIPVEQTTKFGTEKNSQNIQVYYEGNENDKFVNMMNAFLLKYKKNNSYNIVATLSQFNSFENVSYDILGEYWINDMSSTTTSDSSQTLSIGKFLNHARNRLYAYIYSANIASEHITDRNNLKYGISIQNETIKDRISEWDLIDSAGYLTPYDQNIPKMISYTGADNKLNSIRYSLYLTDTYKWQSDSTKYSIIAGARCSYWDLNNELIVSPRVSINVKPNFKHDISFYVSSGIYYQPPFYKEMRMADGLVNKNIKSQQSIQFIAGTDYIFNMWSRPFKFTSEIYLKLFNNLIPYKVDNVRMQYEGQNLAKGYAAGIDFKINGEFVENAESWMSVSLMSTKEDQQNDSYIDTKGNTINPGYYSRPTDQLLNFNMFFQDYLPSNPTYKLNITMIYGSRLPFSQTYTKRYDLQFKLPPYRRVDIGMSKLLFGKEKERLGIFQSSIIKKGWISIEVFNLLDISNTISYTWLRAVNSNNGQAGLYAVPNYLTSRRVNLRINITF